MSNPFDQFDGANSSASNPFDQFDAPPANKKQNKGIAGDLVTDLKRGVEQLPSIVTGLADIPVAAITGKPLIGQAADTVGGITGFAPSKWARDAEAEYSPGRVEARRNVDQAWEDNKTPFADAAGGDFRGIGQIAKSYIQNPQQLVGSVVESLPSMVGGAKAGQFAAKTLGVIAPKTAGFVGEGAVMAGQQMDQLSQTDADPRTAAAASAATGITGGVLGALGGKVASKLGVIDPDVALAGGALRGVTDEAKDQTVKGIVKEGAKRVAGGAVSEGAFEELPQSVLEQVLSNLAQSKPWDDGVSRAAVEGTLAGALMGGAFNVMPPKQEKKADTPPATDTPAENPTLALPAPTYTGTPGDQIIAADSERQVAIDKAQAESDAIWAARDEYERQQAEYRKRPMPTITNDPEPIQQRIDALMGINEARLQGFARTNYEKALENAFAEQIGFVSGKDSQEIPFTMGDYLKSKVAAADIDRKNSAQQPAPVIPVVGALSAAANMAVQSGAHAAHVAQQQAAIQNSQAEASSTKPGKAVTPKTGNLEAAPQLGILAGIAAQAPSIAQSAPNTQPQGQGGMPATAQQGAPVVTSPARVEFDVSKRTNQQLEYLSQNGQPGWREAATAEIQRRGVQISQAQQSNTDAIAPSAMVNPDAPAANSASVPALKASDSAKAPEIQNGDGVTNLPTEKRGIKTIDRWSAEELQGRLDRGNLSPESEQRLRAELAKRQPVKQSAPQASPLTVGKTPNGAEPVTVRNGVVHVGDYPAIDYETEADITVPEGATPQQIADALRNGGVLGSRKIFGLKADEQKPQEKPAVEDTIGWTRMTTVEREALVAKAGWTGKTRGINLGGAIVAKQAWGKMSEANRAKLVAASQIAVKKENPSAATVAEETAAPDQAPIKNQSGDATEMVDAELPPNFDPDIQYAKRQDGSFKTKGEYSPEEWAAYTKSVIDKKLSQPKTDTAPEAKQEQAKASSNKTDRRQIDATRDSLFMAIAKSGGMDTGELLSNGFDASDITYESTARVSKKSGALGKKPRRPLSMGFGLPLHKKGGMSFDGMLEVMKQYGYLPEDATKNDAIDAFRKELGGDHVLTPDAETLKAEADQAEYDAQMLAEQDRIDAELAAQELAESETGYDELNDDQQALADAYADLVFEEDAAQQPERVIAAGMRALGFTEDEINEQLTKDAEAAQAGRQAAEGRSQEGGAGRPGNRAQDEGARQGGQEAGLTLEGQTNAQAAEQFAQQQAGDPAEPTKEQADRERDAVPFSLSEQSQPKPQGVQAGLFTADGRVSSEAKPAENPDALDAAKIRSGYAHRSLGGLSDKVKMEQGWFDAAVKDFAEKVGKNAESVEQKALADKLLAEFKAEYKTRRYRVMDVGSSVVSSAVAGRNNFNSSQAGKRGSALDRAEQSFSDWQNDAIESGVRAIRNARSPEQVLAEQKAKDDKAARNKEKLHSLIGKLMAFKKGDDLQFGNYPVARVTMDREGYPSSVVVDATDLTDNKFDIAKMLFNGDKDALRSAVDEILAEQIEKQQPAQDEGESRQYNTMAEIDSAIEGIFDGSLSLDEYKSAFRGLIKNKDAILAELNKQTKDGLLGRLGPMMAYRLKTAKKSEIVDGSFEAIRNTFALRRSFGPNSYTMSAGALAKYEADKLAALTALVEETTADDLKAFSDEIANDRSARQQKIEAAQDPKTIEDFDNAVRLKKPEGMAAPVVEDSGAGNIVGKDSLSPADTAIYGMSTEGKSASEILKFIVSASRNPLNRQIAKLLLKTGIAPQMAVGTSDGWKFNAGNDKKYAAAYNPKANMVALFRPASAERHVLHELMHAATLKALNQKGLAAGQMKALFAHVEKVGRAQGLFYDKATGRGVYGMADIDEFVAEAFTNPKFQEALKKVSAQKSSGTLSTAWNWFVRIVRGILGMPQGQENALSQAIEIGLGVMRENMALNDNARPKQEALLSMPAVAVRFRIDGDFETVKARARADYGLLQKASQDSGQGTVTTDGKRVKFSTVGFKKASQHGADRRVMAVIANAKKLIESAIPLYSAAPEKVEQGVRRYHYYGVKANFGLGGDALVLLSIKESTNGEWFYDADATGVEIARAVYSAALAGRTKTGAGDTESTAPKGRLASWLAGVNQGERVRYNVADEGWEVAEPSKMDDVIYALQDKQIDMKRVVQSIANAGKKIIDQFNPYLQEELFHGRAAKGVKDFLDFELRPLLKQMQEAKVDMGDFEEYLWNRHAEERNKQIAKINPDMPDGGSGIETAKARAYLAGLSVEQRKTFEALAAKVEAMNRESQRVLIESGLEKQSTIDAWNNAYQHYVPLQREDVDSGHVGTGKGFSVRGSSSKRAMGSGRQVVDIIANLTMQRERNIVRAEKNRVSNALLGLAVQNPNPDFWKVDQAPKERVVNNVAIYNVLDANGKKVADFTKMDEADRMARNIGGEVEQTWGDRVQERIEPGFTSRDNVLLTRINGDDHYVIFNERDERAMRMAMAMKNLDVDNLGRVLSIVGKATRYLASINTQYNPVFGVINLIRDAQGALINLSSTALAGEQKRVLGYTKDALVGIYRDIRAHRAGKKPSSNWAALFEEFQKEGGQTGYRDQYANSEARAEAIKSELEQFKEGKAKQFTRGIFGWLSDYNETMENAVRLAAYKAAKEKGMSNQQAASLAKNITVNFNRKGQMATQVGALYAFFNASVQGTARIAETLFEQRGGELKNVRLSKVGKKIVAGGIMLGSMQAMLLAAAGFDDDEPPEFIRERNLILPIGDGKYLTMAMPLGFHVIPGIGRIATEFVLSGGKDPIKRMASFASMFAESFNPIGSSGFSLQTITPSVVDPFAALAENKDFTGKEIYREDFNKLNPTPGHARAKDVATFYSRWISEALNFITGGTEFKPGLISWSPDSIDYLVAQAGGGVMREANKVFQTAGAAYSGEDLPLYKIPLAGRFIGDTEGQSGQSAKFYEAIKQINMHEAEYKGLLKDGRRQEAAAYLVENPAVKLILAGNHVESQVRKLRSMKRDLVEKEASQDQVRAIDERITATMRKFNDRVSPSI